MTLAFPIEARQGTALWISLGGHNTLIITDNFPFLTSLFCYNKNKVEINCYICELLMITSLFINQYIKLACKHSCWGSKYIPIWIAEVCLIIIFISIYERRGEEGALGENVGYTRADQEVLSLMLYFSWKTRNPFHSCHILSHHVS